MITLYGSSDDNSKFGTFHPQVEVTGLKHVHERLRGLLHFLSGSDGMDTLPEDPEVVSSREQGVSDLFPSVSCSDLWINYLNTRIVRLTGVFFLTNSPDGTVHA